MVYIKGTRKNNSYVLRWGLPRSEWFDSLKPFLYYFNRRFTLYLKKHNLGQIAVCWCACALTLGAAVDWRLTIVCRALIVVCACARARAFLSSCAVACWLPWSRSRIRLFLCMFTLYQNKMSKKWKCEYGARSVYIVRSHSVENILGNRVERQTYQRCCACIASSLVLTARIIRHTDAWQRWQRRRRWASSSASTWFGLTRTRTQMYDISVTSEEMRCRGIWRSSSNSVPKYWTPHPNETRSTLHGYNMSRHLLRLPSHSHAQCQPRACTVRIVSIERVNKNTFAY